MESWQTELIQAQLAKLLAHPKFLNKKRLQTFLAFVVENTLTGEISRLKEILIGVEVYHRDASYNPKENPIVRTEARRLRLLLEDYYEAEGVADPVIIRIPKGSYVAHFEWKIANDPPNGTKEIEEAKGPRKRIGRAPLQAAAGLIGICFVAAAALSFVRKPYRGATWSALPFSRLEGCQEFSSFSPDGKQLAFVWSGANSGNKDIYLQSLDAGAPTRLTESPAEETRPSWSPDGKRIAFIRLIGNGRKELNVITLATRRESKIAELKGSAPWLCIIPRISWSSDGQRLITSAGVGDGQACGVVSIEISTGRVRKVTVPPPGVVGDLEPQVSPDGRQIAFIRNAGEMGGDIYRTGVNGGATERATFDNRDIMGFSWSSDSKSFVTASRRGDGVLKLWQIAVDGQRAKQLTDGTAAVAFPAASAMGDRLSFTSYRNITSIWRASPTKNSLLVSEQSGNSNPQSSADGSRLVFRSDRTGAFELWTSDRNGEDIRRLTHFNGPMVSSPTWSPDGSQVAFECRPQAHSQICLIDASGKSPARLFTKGICNEILPSWSRDGRSIYFSSNRSGRWEIYKQPAGDAGSEAVQMTRKGGIRAVESWDGRYLYVHRGEPAGGIVRLRVDGGVVESTAKSGEEAVFAEDLTGGMWGDWDAGPEGIMFLAPLRSGRQAVSVLNPASGLRKVLFALDANPPQGDRTFAVEPGGASFLYMKTDRYGGELGLLERHSSGER